MDNYLNLILAVILSSLIGLERGWQSRNDNDGTRIAGFRTFTIVGIFAALSSFLSININQYFLIVSFIGFIIFVISVYKFNSSKDVGITTEVTMLTAFVISMVASYGYRYIATVSAITLVIILNFKPQIHYFIKKISLEEFIAFIKFLLLVAVIYPLLPDQPLGNWTTLTYTDIFEMVIILASISFMGYIAIKIVGTEKGILLSSIMGGLVSSTAVTVSLSKYYKENSTNQNFFIFGIIISWLIMYIRIFILTIIFSPKNFIYFFIPIFTISLVIALYLIFLKRNLIYQKDLNINIKNPIEISSSIKFASILSIISFIAEKGKELYGNTGILIVGLFSGFADVDAITIFLSKTSLNISMLKISLIGIFLASFVNTIIKNLLSFFIGGRNLALPLIKITFSIIIVGGISLFAILKLFSL
ncbi:MAG: MgtC/SapB family protein [Deferribacterales bacterium]